eukprot:1998306-Alexandrium_andersonii.AAC.1
MLPSGGSGTPRGNTKASNLGDGAVRASGGGRGMLAGVASALGFGHRPAATPEAPTSGPREEPRSVGSAGTHVLPAPEQFRMENPLRVCRGEEWVPDPDA